MSDLTDHYFPFYKLGLQRNPFGTLTPDETFAATVLPPAVEQALVNGLAHLVVLGDKGRGKSTTLRWLETYYRKHGLPVAYERIPRWHWHYRTVIAPLDVFALDEAQRLTPWQVRRLFRERGHRQLLIGSHRDLSGAFRRRGLPVQTVRLEKAASQPRLAAILARRLAVLAYGEAGPGVHFTPGAVNYLWGRFGSDLRTMNFFLYDVFETIAAPGPVTRAQLDRF